MSGHFRVLPSGGLCQMSDDAATMGRLLYAVCIIDMPPPSRFFGCFVSRQSLQLLSFIT